MYVSGSIVVSSVSIGGQLDMDPLKHCDERIKRDVM